MKKILIFTNILIISLMIVGCAGLGDYDIKLINGYIFTRTSAHRNGIYAPDKEKDYVLIPDFDKSDDSEYITQIGHDNNCYIIAKTNLNVYYILDSKKDVVYRFENKTKFDKKRKDLKILDSVRLKDLYEYNDGKEMFQ